MTFFVALVAAARVVEADDAAPVPAPANESPAASTAEAPTRADDTQASLLPVVPKQPALSTDGSKDKPEGGAAEKRAEQTPAKAGDGSKSRGPTASAEDGLPQIAVNRAKKRLLGAWRTSSGTQSRVEFFHPNGSITTSRLAPNGAELSSSELGRYTITTQRDGLVLAIIIRGKADPADAGATPPPAAINEFLLEFHGAERLLLRPYAVTVGGTRVTAKEQPKRFPQKPLIFYRFDLTKKTKLINDEPKVRHKAAVAALRRLGILYGEKRSSVLFTRADDSLLALARPHLEQLSAVADVRLSRSAITDAGLAHLAGLRGLRVIDLSHTKINGTGLGALWQLPKLRELKLTKAPITDAGLAEIGKLRALESLDVTSTDITDAGIKRLETLTLLNKLDARGTDVSTGAVDALSKRLSKLRVVLLGPIFDAP